MRVLEVAVAHVAWCTVVAADVRRGARPVAQLHRHPEHVGEVLVQGARLILVDQAGLLLDDVVGELVAGDVEALVADFHEVAAELA